MIKTIGIRREDKNKWERRAPITPQHVKKLKEEYNIQTKVQPSKIRIFEDNEYEKNGGIIQEDLSDCPVVFAIKEIPINFFKENKTYVFFSHTIKGQKYNMPMLKKMMQLNCNLIDYEKITDEAGKRLVFFGKYAGISGMIDSLWAFGKRMSWKGVSNPFEEIKQTIYYDDINEIKQHLKIIGKKIKQNGLPEILTPMIIGITGYGNVSKGAQEILDFLPIKEIRPNQIQAINENFSDKIIYKVVFKEKDIVEPISSEMNFNLQDYYNNPHFYRSIFEKYLRSLSILMNCIYWDERYPRLITKDFLEENFTGQMKLQLIGDISVDVNGAIEFTEKTTTPDEPVFIYNPIREDIIEGFKGNGVAIMAIDNLPSELPKESSTNFSKSIIDIIPDIVNADYTVNFNQLNLQSKIKRAIILYQGKLTPNYQYMNNFL